MTIQPHNNPDYPQKPIKLIVAFPPGGPADHAAKALQKIWPQYLPQPLEIEFQAGQGGVLGSNIVMAAKADGYTLGLSAAGALAIQPHMRQTAYGDVNTYTPIINIVNNPICLVVRQDSPYRNIQDLIEAAKKHPGTISIANQDQYAIPHLVMEQLCHLEQINIHHLHFPSGTDGLKALLKGEIEGVSNHPSIIYHSFLNKEIRVLGVFEPERNPLFPKAPTFREAGYDITLGGYLPLIGPKGIPTERISVIHNAFKKALSNKDFLVTMADKGVSIQYQGSAEIKNRLAKDYSTASDALKLAGL